MFIRRCGVLSRTVPKRCHAARGLEMHNIFIGCTRGEKSTIVTECLWGLRWMEAKYVVSPAQSGA